MVAPILVNGLTGGTSAMILGQFNLGWLDVVVEEIDGGDKPLSKKKKPSDKVRVTFIIKHKKNRWTRTYIVDRSTGNIIIKITSFINTTINRIKITVTNIRKRLSLSNITIRRKR